MKYCLTTRKIWINISTLTQQDHRSKFVFNIHGIEARFQRHVKTEHVVSRSEIPLQAIISASATNETDMGLLSTSPVKWDMHQLWLHEIMRERCLKEMGIKRVNAPVSMDTSMNIQKNYAGLEMHGLPTPKNQWREQMKGKVLLKLSGKLLKIFFT